jgi:kumamolisin
MSDEMREPPAGYVRLHGSDRAPRPGFHVAGPVDGDQPVRVVLKLQPEQQPPDPATLGAVRPSERGTYDSRAEHSAVYGAAQSSVDAVVRFADEHGLSVAEADAASRMVILTGSAATMSAAFGTELQEFRSDETGEAYRGRVGHIHIPQSLSDVVTLVSGLDNRRQVKPRQLVARRRPRTVTYTTPDLAQIYEFPPNVDGTGQCIGLLEFGGGYHQADLDQYFQSLNINGPTVTAVSIDGTQNSPGNDADYEVVLDIEVAGAAAPGAAIVVYFAQFTAAGWIETLTKAVHDATHRPSVLSVSWGYSEFEGDNTFAWTGQVMDEVNTVLAEAANLGVTVIVAAGDDGSIDGITTDGKVHADFPSSSPYVLSCGGTTLQAPNRTWHSETVWSRGIRAQGPGHGSTGGGVSDRFPVPAWQSGSTAQIPVSASTGFAGRGLPDVAAVADGLTGYYQFINGQTITDGGTSAATPLWAGLIARVNQHLSQATPDAKVGYWNPVLYQSIGPTAGVFHDIDTGSNDALGDLNGAYTAAPGWDACTGWGTPRGTALLAAL